MPKTKVNSRAAPAVQLSAEDLKEVETILQDFDQQCDKFMADVAKDNETLLDSLANSAKLELFKWPKTARKKKLGDIFPPADSDIWKNYEELEAAALAGKSDPSSSSTTDSLASSSVENNALEDAMEEVAESVASQVKRGIKSTRKKGAAAVARTKVLQTPSVMAHSAMLPPSTGVRRSTRKRMPTDRAMETPMMNTMTSTGNRTRGRTASIVKGNAFETPCIRAATRADMMTPLNRSVARIAKPGERLFLVSDNSSPIVDGTYTATKGRAKKAIKPAKVAADEVKIPLGGGRTLMLPVDAEEGGLNDLDLDTDAREKILKIKAMLDKVQF